MLSNVNIFRRKPHSFGSVLVQLLFLLLLIPLLANGQRNPAYYQYPYNHLDWYTIESDHFYVNFQEGNSRPAQVISRIAEEIYGPITRFYDYEPDQKVSIVLIDRLDYSNGAAFFYDNKIEIWLPSLDTPLRGTHSWLRNVITHEFTHIVQLQASMKRSRKLPAYYVQWLSYEDVRRPDVLYGFPRGLISYPFAGISMPAWLAEGTAQYMHDELFYDDWDTHRDMFLRTRIVDGSYLSLEKMGTFTSKTSLERELVYNQGFAFTNYIADRFGKQAIVDITKALSQRGVYDVRKAINMVTDIDGRDLFTEWIEELEAYYDDFNAERETKPENRTWIEPLGFFNFNPTFSPDGTQIAYLSNKFMDGALASLYIIDVEKKEELFSMEVPLFENPSQSHFRGSDMSGVNSKSIQHSHGTNMPVSSGSSSHSHHNHFKHLESLQLRRLETSFSFSPDGSQIVYSRPRLNAYGEQYRDLYLFEIDSGDSKRLTYSQRMQDPAWSPDGSMIASGKIEDGSVNLYLYHPETDSLQPVTHFQKGEQLYKPVWHPDGNSLFFAFSNQSHRAIYRVDLSDESSHLLPVSVLESTQTDFRDPVISSDGAWLYFSADYGGVFNIYRMSLANKAIEQLTNVIGGAFMPYPHPEKNQLLYSEFVSEGYKIALLDLSKEEYVTKAEFFQSADEHAVLRADTDTGSKIYQLNVFDDSDIAPFLPEIKSYADTSTYTYSLPTRGASSERSFYRYDDQFTSFQFYPVLRFDNYTRRRGDNLTLLTSGRVQDLGDNLWRDVKLGTYFASIEMLERFSMYGAIMVGPGSRSSDGVSNFFRPNRLVNLDRDIFLEVEYSDLPLIKRHWSPTISLAFYNVRRNVEDGLQIEEFPCTSCLPDTTYTDIAYNMWEAELSLISKINRWSLIELSYTYSPYRVSIESFYSREYQQEVSGSTSRYYQGTTMGASWIFDLALPDRHGDIAPMGLSGLVRYRYEPSELLDSYDIRDGTLIPVYDKFNNHSGEIDVRTGFPILQQRFNIRTRLFSYLDGPDEFFFQDYIGGMIGMRSYPYFALGGTTTAFTQLSWFVPVKTDIYHQSGRFTLDKIFLRFFAEAGNGWGGPLNINKEIKTGAGAELRIAMNSYYFFPSRFFISAAYGFNSYDLQLPDAFITDSSRGRVEYGNQILINFGLLFNFDF